MYNYSYILAWEDAENVNLMAQKSLPIGEEATVDGSGKGHTNLIGDSCLSTDIKQGQKKVTSSNVKPLLQFKRQDVQQTSGDHLLVDQTDKAGGKDTGSSRSSTPDTFLAAGNAERAFFNVCLVGNNSDVKGKEDGIQSKYSVSVVSTQESTSLDSKYSDNDDDKATSIKVVNEILGEIEIDHQQDLKNELNKTTQNLIDINDADTKVVVDINTRNITLSQNNKSEMMFEAYKTSNSCIDNDGYIPNTNMTYGQSAKIAEDMLQGPSNSGNIPTSLVVDIHIPPNDDGSFLLDKTDPKVVGPQKTNAAGKEDINLRPCKHEINRFQRCYSDTSQLNKKRKQKVMIMFTGGKYGYH